MSKPASIANIAFDTGVIAERERIQAQLDAYGEDPLSPLDDWLQNAINAESNDSLAKGHDWGALDERNRIIKLLSDQNIIRRCAATNLLVAFNTDGTQVLYIKGLEKKEAV